MEKATEHNEQCTMGDVQWKKVKLGEVGEIVSGGTPSTSNEAFWDGGVLFVTPLDLGRKKEIGSTIRTISELGANNSSANKIKKNSLAISTRAPIGLMSIVNQEFTTNQGCKSIQFFDNYDCQFFYYYLLYNVEQIRRHGQGTTFMEISKTDFANVEISFPSLPTQRRIVAILSAADKVIEQTRQLISKYKSIKQGMMEDLLEPKEGWKKVRFGDVSEIITGPFGSSLHEKDYTKTGTPIVNPQNIVNGKVIPIDKCLVSDETVERLSKFKINVGDIVIARRGEMGRCAVVEENQEGWLCGTGSFVIKVDFEKIDPNFIQLQLSSDNTKIILENNSIGATMSNLNQGILYELEFLVPNLPEQRRIAKILSGIDKKIEAEEKVLEKNEKVKKGLMERLLKENDYV
jgi:type I restriction enzyme S subunit